MRFSCGGDVTCFLSFFYFYSAFMVVLVAHARYFVVFRGWKKQLLS